ncbi:hypothetical protein [Novosphingobium aquae]|uniref:Lipoprotein n=1 Tax=Novosphingobium aquae TaxID=3133435 RepID=A0ABU8SCJ3_9SPHN
MNKKALTLAGSVVLCIGLSGCDKVKGWLGMKDGDAAAPKSAQAGSSRHADISDPRNGAIANLLEGMSPEVRTEYDRLLPAAKAQLAEKIENADSHPQRVEQLAYFLTDNDKELSFALERAGGYQAALKRMEQAPEFAPGNSAADKQRLVKQFAEVLAEIEARRSSIALALGRDSILTEAYKLWRAQNPKSQTITDLTKVLLTEPCRRDWSSNRSTDSFLNFRGVALGMTEGEAMKGICAANGRSVSIAGRQNAESHKFESTGKDNDREMMEAARKLSKPYLGSLIFCFDCISSTDRPANQFHPGQSDILAAHFSPAGQIFGLERAQNFINRSENSSTDAPRKLNLLLPEMEKRFGAPSYIFEDTTALVVAWVYLDRKSPLPLERWYFSPGQSYTQKLQFRSHNLVYERGEFSQKLLARQKPVASYCAIRYGEAQTRDTQTLMGFFKGDSDIVSTKDCGVIVTAKFYKQSKGDGSPDRMILGNSPTPVNPSMNIYWVEMTIRDVTSILAWRGGEMVEIKQASKSTVQEFERKASNPEGPVFRP